MKYKGRIKKWHGHSMGGKNMFANRLHSFARRKTFKRMRNMVRHVYKRKSGSRFD